MGRRVSLMLATVRERRGGSWVYALSFRRDALSVLDVAFVAAECFPPRPRCAVEDALLDELLDACVSGALDLSLRLFGREQLLSEVGLQYEFDAPARVSRLASGGCRIGVGFALGRKFLVSVSAPSTCQPS